MARLAGHPGHAHEPNHASSVIPIPPSAARNPREMGSMRKCTSQGGKKPLDKSGPAAPSFLIRIPIP